MQVFVGAMAMGLITLGVVVTVVYGPAELPPAAPADAEAAPPAANAAANNDGGRVAAQVALVLALAALVLHRLIGSAVCSLSTRNLPADEPAAIDRLLRGYAKGVAVSVALLDGPAVFCLIVYGFVHGDRWLLAMAGLLLMAVLTKLPFVPQVEAWLADRLRAAGLRGMG